MHEVIEIFTLHELIEIRDGYREFIGFTNDDILKFILNICMHECIIRVYMP